MRRFTAALALVLAACAGPRRHVESLSAAPEVAPAAPAAATRPAEDRVASLSARVAAKPRLYPVWAQLGEARLERARLTHDPAEAREAQKALETSLSIQENFEALLMMTALANFRHRFEDALGFGERAARASPSDTSVLSMRIEALASLGRLDEAEKLLRSAGPQIGDFHVTASEARLLLERGDLAGAIAAFTRAAEIARGREAPFFEAWANLRIAEQLLDSGQPEKAPPYLATARKLAPHTRDLAVHEAELLGGLGRPAETVAGFQSLLRKSDDPFLHAAIVPFAREAHDSDLARKHFEIAEKALLSITDQGEVFALESLAALYEAEGSRPDRAAEFARRNFTHKRDRHAREILERLTKAAGTSDPRR